MAMQQNETIIEITKLTIEGEGEGEEYYTFRLNFEDVLVWNENEMKRIFQRLNWLIHTEDNGVLQFPRGTKAGTK